MIESRVIIDSNPLSKNDLISQGKKAYRHICIKCNREFYNNSSNGTVCGKCHTEFKCNSCGDWNIIKYNFDKYRKKNEYICKKCSDRRNIKFANSKEAIKNRYENNKDKIDKILEEGRKKAHTEEANQNRYQAQLDNGTFENFYKAGIKASLTPEARKKQNETKKKNGYYQSKAFENVIKSSHSKEAIEKSQKTRKESGALDYWIENVAKNNSNEYSTEKIIQIIENSEFKNRPDVSILLSRIKQFKNYNENIKNILIDKARELDIPISYREEFYKDKFDCISFNDENIKINLDLVNNLNKVPGVWSIWSSDNICMDVAQTNNIGEEIKIYSRRLEFNSKFNNEKEIELYNKNHQNYNRMKFKNIFEDCNNKYILRLVSVNIESEIEREKIEAQYAHDNKARYWSPAPGQVKRINNNLK